MGHRGRGRLAAGPKHRSPPAAADARLTRFGQPRHHFASVESTQAIARQLAEDGAPEGTLVTADEQTAGRGRLGNSFYSPPGGLYCSLILRPSLLPAQAPLIGLAAGLALAEAVADLTSLVPVLKWPNDLLLKGRKLSGMLLEAASSGGQVRYAIQGIGVNVNTSGFAEGLSATSLFLELGRPVSPEALLDAVMERFESRNRSLPAAEFVAAWRAWPNLLGGRVRVAADPLWDGIAEDLDSDGALLVRTLAGDLRRVIAADVHLLG